MIDRFLLLNEIQPNARERQLNFGVIFQRDVIELRGVLTGLANQIHREGNGQFFGVLKNELEMTFDLRCLNE